MADFTRVTLTIAEFRTRFPEFASTSDAVIQDRIDEALLIHSIRKLATMYCTAHLIITNGMPSTPISGGGSSMTNNITIHGETQSRQVGPLRETFTTLAESGSSSGSGITANARPQHELTFFGRTEYGRQFLVLEARSPRSTIGAMVAGMARR